MAEKKTKKKEAAAPATAAKAAAPKKAPKPAAKKTAAKPAKPAAKNAPVKVAVVKEKPAAAPPAARRPLGPVEEMEHLLEHLWRRPFMAPSWLGRLKLPELMGEVSPSVDIYEEGNSVVVKAEVPGVKREDLDLVLTEDTISISGHKKSEEAVHRHDFHRVERSFGSFTRRLRLPATVVPDKAKATFKDGVLEVVVPKADTGREANVRRITVA
jgi:HSP20 family protein